MITIVISLVPIHHYDSPSCPSTLLTMHTVNALLHSKPLTPEGIINFQSSRMAGGGGGGGILPYLELRNRTIELGINVIFAVAGYFCRLKTKNGGWWGDFTILRAQKQH